MGIKSYTSTRIRFSSRRGSTQHSLIPKIKQMSWSNKNNSENHISQRKASTSLNIEQYGNTSICQNICQRSNTYENVMYYTGIAYHRGIDAQNSSKIYEKYIEILIQPYQNIKFVKMTVK